MPKQKPKNADRAKKERLLIKEVGRCLLLKKEDKDFWISRAHDLPEAVLDNTLKSVSLKNKVVDKYMRTALAEDKNHLFLSEIKADVEKIKRQAFSIDEKTQNSEVEQKLTRELKEIDD